MRLLIKTPSTFPISFAVCCPILIRYPDNHVTVSCLLKRSVQSQTSIQTIIQIFEKKT